MLAFSGISILIVPFLIAIFCSRKRTPVVPALATETKAEWYARMREHGHLPPERSPAPTDEYPPVPKVRKPAKPRKAKVEAPTEPIPVVILPDEPNEPTVEPTEPAPVPLPEPVETPEDKPKPNPRPKRAPRVHRDPAPAPAPVKVEAAKVTLYGSGTQADADTLARYVAEQKARSANV